MNENLSCIGQPTLRRDAWDKVSGRAVYTEDICLPGMLHAVALRSPFPHARILKVDATAALTLPGVRAVLTAADLPQRLAGDCIKDVPVLAADRVRFVGERVAVAAAVDEATARRAVNLIRVEYQPLPAVFDTVQAMQAGAPLVHEDLEEFLKPDEQVKGNVYAYERLVRGDLEKGWAQSDCIFEDIFTTQSVHQGYMERHAAVAMVEPDGSATIWSSNKQPFRLRQLLATYLGCPENALRVVAPCIGGDFGGKGAMMDEPLCYFLSRATGKPVKMVMRRSEELAAANPRHPAVIIIKSGLKKSGELVARQVKVIFNSGAYGGVKPGVLVRGYAKGAGPYRIPHVLIEGYSVYTNSTPCGNCRSPGDPQAAFAVESHTDRLARRLGMDPYAFRLMNVLQEGEEAPTGEKWHGIRAREVLEEAARRGGWHDPRPPGTGKGLCLAYRNTGGGESGAVVMVNADGSVELLTGAMDTGGGAWTVLRQIAAEELHVQPEMVMVVPGDTAVAPFDTGSGASRVTHVAGRAVERAAKEALKRMTGAVAEHLGCQEEEVVGGQGEFWQISRPEQHLSWGAVAALACKKGPVIGHGIFSGMPKDTTAFAAHLAEIRVDPETGGVELTRLVAVHDIGRVLNPPAAEGQVEGAVTQGMGFALWEEQPRQEGKLLSPYLADYQQPTSLDMPEIEVAFLEGAQGPAPFGGKGIGEVPINPVAAAIANALEDATGVRLEDLPMTPERCWRAIRSREVG